MPTLKPVMGKRNEIAMIGLDQSRYAVMGLRSLSLRGRFMSKNQNSVSKKVKGSRCGLCRRGLCQSSLGFCPCSDPPFSEQDGFPGPQWIPETVESTKRCTSFPPPIHTSIHPYL